MKLLISCKFDSKLLDLDVINGNTFFSNKTIKARSWPICVSIGCGLDWVLLYIWVNILMNDNILTFGLMC